METHIVRRSEIVRSPRVIQVEGLFDIPKAKISEMAWDVTLPLDDQAWQIGLIVGPSGSGKSTILDEIFGSSGAFDWPIDRAVVDAFAESLSAKDVTGALSSVGFSSPPSWLRPFAVLSNGEQFRAQLARVLLETPDLAIVDEFTSVVDRRVAKVASAAVAKYVRRTDRQLVVASCHYDVIDWLQPDWIYDTGKHDFKWRHLQPRPGIDLVIRRGTRADWGVFRQHHYLSGNLAAGCKCFVGEVDGVMAGFASALPYPTVSHESLYREHRTVVLPDFQGVGLGNALSELVASLYRAKGSRYRSVTSSPAMIRHRAKSAVWKMDRKPSMVTGSHGKAKATSIDRFTASFEYVGPPASPEQVEILLPESVARHALLRGGPGRAALADRLAARDSRTAYPSPV